MNLCWLAHLFVRLFEVFHEDGNNDIDQDELRHEYEDDEEERSKVW